MCFECKRKVLKSNAVKSPPTPPVIQIPAAVGVAPLEDRPQHAVQLVPAQAVDEVRLHSVAVQAEFEKANFETSFSFPS
jgi:hypothetical protein